MCSGEGSVTLRPNRMKSIQQHEDMNCSKDIGNFEDLFFSESIITTQQQSGSQTKQQKTNLKQQVIWRWLQDCVPFSCNATHFTVVWLKLFSVSSKLFIFIFKYISWMRRSYQQRFQQPVSFLPHINPFSIPLLMYSGSHWILLENVPKERGRLHPNTRTAQTATHSHLCKLLINSLIISWLMSGFTKKTHLTLKYIEDPMWAIFTKEKHKNTLNIYHLTM